MTHSPPLSARLQCCAEFVRPGARVADIGCDHGYLGIRLLQIGRAASVHACDLREKPLEKARENAARCGMTEKMRFSLADGLAAVAPGEVDTVIVAGMGGDVIARILGDCPWTCDPAVDFILQPQSSGNDLRRKLPPLGFRIEAERLVRDGGFLYQAMLVRFGDAVPLTPGQHYVSPALLGSGDSLLPDYFARLIPSLEQTVAGLRRGNEPLRLKYYETALCELCEMRKRYGNRR